MRKRKKSAQALVVRRGTALDGFRNPLARLGAGTPNLLDSTQYVMSRMTNDFGTLNAMYRDSWIVRRIVDIIPADMLKNWITITSGLAPDLIKKIDVELRRTQLIKKIQEGLCWGRLYGGAIGIMLIKGQGSPEQLAMPLALEEMVPGDFKGLMILDRWNGVSPSSELVDDISDPEYGLPDAYIVTDPVDGAMTRVHHTRCIRFTGNALPFWEKQAELYWGASVIESVFDELKKRDNVSWNIAQLTFMANLRVLKMNDIGQTLAATDPQSQAELYRTLTAQNWLMSNMGIQIMDAADGLETHQYTFGGLADCYQQFIMDISGAAEIPVTKLFGRSPSGLNATGESDLQNYYDMIGEKQESILRPILNKLLPPFMMSMFGAVPDDLDFDFNPVSEPSDKERMELAKTGTDNVVAALNAGMISKRTGLQELKQQSERTGVWTNITDEDIEKAPDEIEDPGEMMPPGMDFGGGEKTDAPKPPQRPGNEPGQGNGQAGNENATAGESGRDAALFHVLDADWDESEHPRGDDGKFRAGSGVGKNKGERDQARQKLTALWNKKSTPEVQAQIEQLKTVSGDNVVKEDLTPGQYDANMRNAKKQLLGRSFPGGKITKITSHANVRMIGRDIPPRQVLDILQNAARSFPGNRPNTTCYEKDNKRVVVDGNGQIMSVMHVYRRRKDGNKTGAAGFFKV
jgi:phage-related protein (TIGR01555 family)